MEHEHDHAGDDELEDDGGRVEPELDERLEPDDPERAEPDHDDGALAEWDPARDHGEAR
jgi:hypothetical protein